MTPTAASGTGWSCGIVAQTVTCTRNAVLISAAIAPTITLTVDVAANAAAQVTNTASVSGAGNLASGNDSDDDPTTIRTILVFTNGFE